MTFNLQENYNCWGFLLWKAVSQWNRGFTLSSLQLFLWVSWYLVKKWCLITELCISLSCKMALRWAPCYWGRRLYHCNVPLARICADRTPQEVYHNDVILKMLLLFLCYMELQEWLHSFLQWKCPLRWRSFNFVRSQKVLAMHLAVDLYSGLAIMCNRGSSVQIWFLSHIIVFWIF